MIRNAKTWLKTEINKNQIQRETARALFINCSHNSKYDGWGFWLPKSLLREGSHSASLTILLPNDFKIELIRKSRRQNIAAEECIQIFENIEEQVKVKTDDSCFVEVKEPKKIEIIKKRDVLDEFKNAK